MPTFKHLTIIKFVLSLALSYICLYSVTVKAKNYQELSLKSAVLQAHQNDLWLIANKHQEDALFSMSQSESSLPDPTISVAMANLATDSFAFNQEPMSQVKLGISQQFPRGDTLALKEQKLQSLAKQQPFLRQERQAKVAIEVSQLWLEAYKAQQIVTLIQKDRPLFKQLADIAESNYSAAFGATRQFDIVQAELELTQLDDRLTRFMQQESIAKAKLIKWLSKYQPQFSEESLIDINSENILLTNQLPTIQSIIPATLNIMQAIDTQQLIPYFSQHPAVKSLEQKIKASQSDISLAKQKFKPAWGLKADYGYRGNDNLGHNRADLFSIGVTFDLPIFTDNKQDKALKSALSKTEAVKVDKWLLLRQMLSDFKKLRVQLAKLNQRQDLYQQRLLPQVKEQAEAALTAYSNDDGNFSEVVRARIGELNATIDALEIDTEMQLIQVKLNYFFVNEPIQMVGTTDTNKALGESHEE